MPGRTGTLAGKLAPMAGSDDRITWLSDRPPPNLPQVNGTVESLGERRGYAPFSPDENSLVLFDGRAGAVLGWGWVVNSVSGGPRLGEGLPGVVCPYSCSSHHAQGMRYTPQSGNKNTTERSRGSAASRVRSSYTPVILSCRVSRLPLDWGEPGGVNAQAADGSLTFPGRAPLGLLGPQASQESD